MNARPTVAVIGSGVAGSAIAHEFLGRGVEVCLLYRSAEEGSSFTNQKWHHSGLLYPDEPVVKKAWAAYQLSNRTLLEYILKDHEPASFLCLQSETLERRRQWLLDWKLRELGLDWQDLDAPTLAQFPLIRGGFRGPDRAVDFPALIRRLRKEIATHGGTVIEGARVTRLLLDRASRRVQGVAYQLAGREYDLPAHQTILAAGAWSVDLLEQATGIKVPKVVRKKCVVLSYPGEYVRGITVCLDVRKADGSMADTTLVPFHGRTLAAGIDCKCMTAVDGATATAEEIADLTAELAQWCPQLAQVEASAYVCFKTEPYTGTGPPDVLPRAYGRDDLGVAGLTFAFPGKASFMFELARQVADGQETDEA